MADLEGDKSIKAGTQAGKGTTRVEVEGKPIEENVAYPARTPRDVAIHKTRAGEDVGLEESRPDRTEPIALPSRVRGAKEFVDASGQHWTKGEVDEAKVPQIDPDALRKDGGDPGTLNIPPNRSGERYAVPGASNESFSPEGVMDPESGDIRPKSIEEGGLEPSDAKEATLVPVATKLTGEKRASATPKSKTKKEPVAKGRGGSSAKSKAAGKARGGAKAKAVRSKK